MKATYVIEYLNKRGEEKKVTRCEDTVEKAVQELEGHGCTVVTWYDKEEVSDDARNI